MTDQDIDLSAAITLYLAHYPGNSTEAFAVAYPDASVRESVRNILHESLGLPIEWGQKTLVEVGDDVERIMRERHPDLSDAALRQLGNYYTYLMR